MQRPENDQNSGKAIFMVSGRQTGVKVTLIGDGQKIKAILKTAIEKSRALTEILAGLDIRSAGNAEGEKGGFRDVCCKTVRHVECLDSKH